MVKSANGVANATAAATWCTTQASGLTSAACLFNAGNAYLVTNFTLVDISNSTVFASACS